MLVIYGSILKDCLWYRDPINKVAWLWPSGFGTMQGGFNRTMLEIKIPNTTIVARANPRLAVVPCPAAATSSDPAIRSHCLWVGVTTNLGMMTFYQPLTSTDAPSQTFAPRYRTQMQAVVAQPRPLVVPPPSKRADATTGDRFTLQNRAFKVIVSTDAATFTVIDLLGSMQLRRQFESAFTVLFSSTDPELSDLKDFAHGTTGSSIYSIADDVPSYWRKRQTPNVFKSSDEASPVIATAAKAINSTAIELSFPPTAKLQLTALLSLPDGSDLPRLSWTLQAKTAGYFSAGFVGAPAIAVNDTLGFAQPGNCFAASVVPSTRCPLNESFVVPDAGANLPYALVPGADGSNVALIADPSSAIQFESCEPWPDHPKTFSPTCPTHDCPLNSAADGTISIDCPSLTMFFLKMLVCHWFLKDNPLKIEKLWDHSMSEQRVGEWSACKLRDPPWESLQTDLVCAGVRWLWLAAAGEGRTVLHAAAPCSPGHALRCVPTVGW